LEFLAGVVSGAVVLLLVLGLCRASGRAELEMEIMELENVLADLRAELTRQKGQEA
jgi:hypothetical protein